METTEKQKHSIRIYFIVSILVKGVISFVEVVAGLFALFVPLAKFGNFITEFAQAELIEEPGNLIATYSMQLAHQLSIESGVFIAVYLLSRGLIKLLLVVALIKDKLWAYPSSLAVMTLFVLYQFYQIATTHSILIILLTLFDFIVMWLIWREYQILKANDRAKLIGK